MRISELGHEVREGLSVHMYRYIKWRTNKCINLVRYGSGVMKMMEWHTKHNFTQAWTEGLSRLRGLYSGFSDMLRIFSAYDYSTQT